MKKIIIRIIKCSLEILPINFIFFLSQKLSYFMAKLIHFRDWSLAGDSFPQFYRHDLNLYLWRFNTNAWSFTARGVLTRIELKRNCNVLDLFSGDGSIPFLFYTDITNRIDAIDKDKSAIDFALKNYKKKNIRHLQIDLTSSAPPANDYDFIVWNAGINYLEINEIHQLLQKIISSNKKKFTLLGSTPLKNGHPDHKTEFESESAIADLLRQYFSNVITMSIDQNGSKQIFFKAKQV